MGWDLALAGLVLMTAVRGWFRGFVLQAIRLGGLVGCVYLADPIRDGAKPYVAPQLPSIEPETLDRLLWWASCVVAYVLTVGLATWAVKVYRQRPYGDPELHKGDQAAGLLLGATKGLIIAAFLTAAVEQYALEPLQGFDWVDQQAHESQALAWSRQYRPAQRIWASEPVRNFVAHIQRQGLRLKTSPAPKAGPAEAATSRADTDHPRALQVPPRA
jgi:uncharacterized membrane protein required for colicin V production